MSEKCPFCDSTNIEVIPDNSNFGEQKHYRCNDCGVPYIIGLWNKVTSLRKKEITFSQSK